MPGTKESVVWFFEGGLGRRVPGTWGGAYGFEREDEDRTVDKLLKQPASLDDSALATLNFVVTFLGSQNRLLNADAGKNGKLKTIFWKRLSLCPR